MHLELDLDPVSKTFLIDIEQNQRDVKNEPGELTKLSYLSKFQHFARNGSRVIFH